MSPTKRQETIVCPACGHEHKIVVEYRMGTEAGLLVGYVPIEDPRIVCCGGELQIETVRSNAEEFPRYVVIGIDRESIQARS